MPEDAAPKAAELSFLAFDYGLKRTGVATGNTVLGQASPLTTIAAEGEARRLPAWCSSGSPMRW